MAYTPFGPVEENSGALRRSSKTTESKVLDAQLKMIDYGFAKSAASNGGVNSDQDYSDALSQIDALQSVHPDSIFQSKFTGYLTKYQKAQNTTDFGNVSINQKNQWIQRTISDLEGAKGQDGFVSPDDAKQALDNWTKANPLNKVSEIKSYFAPYINHDNHGYPADLVTPKSTTLLGNIESGIGSFFGSLWKGVTNPNQ